LFSFGIVALIFRCTSAAPFPNGVIPALEQIVCHVAENQTIESMAVQDVCGEVGKVYPAGNATCETDLKKAWGSFAEQCNNMDHLADWVQEQFCKISGNAAIEAEVAAVSCGLIRTAVPGIPTFVCTKAMERTWRLLASECPKTVASAPALAAPVGDIEKLICGMMENKTIEHQASQQICQYTTKVDPSANVTLCTTKVEGLWESFEGECKDIASWAIFMKNEFCYNAKNQGAESQFIETVCGLAHYAAPQVPDMVCKMAMQEAWSALASECPAAVTQPSILV
jgi:hypothetical protein